MIFLFLPLLAAFELSLGYALWRGPDERFHETPNKRFYRLIGGSTLVEMQIGPWLGYECPWIYHYRSWKEVDK